MAKIIRDLKIEITDELEEEVIKIMATALSNHYKEGVKCDNLAAVIS